MRSVLLSLVAVVVACTGEPRERLNFSLNAAPRIAQDGSMILELKATIPAGWHLYGPVQTEGGPVPLSVTVIPGGLFAMAGALVGPPPDRMLDTALNIVTETYRDSVDFWVPVRAINATPEDALLRIAIHASACTPGMCVPPIDDTLETMVGTSTNRRR